MAKQHLDRPLEVSVDISAAPSAVWRVVSDLRRTGEWSPECCRVVPLGRVRQGSWLLGLNRRNRVRWATLSRVVRLEPEQEISWKVLTNGSVWTYRIDPSEGGSRVVERRETPNGIGAFASWFTRRLLGGQVAHDDELEVGMRHGLERIGELARD